MSLIKIVNFKKIEQEVLPQQYFIVVKEGISLTVQVH